MANSDRNDDGITLLGFIRNTKAVMHESFLDMPDWQIVGWKREWNDICEDHWRFAMAPEQAIEAIRDREGFA